MKTLTEILTKKIEDFGVTDEIIEEAVQEYLKQPLYAFLYNPMIHESGYVTMSVHHTRKGAEKALEYHKHEIKKEWESEDHAFPFDHFRYWKIEEITIQD